MSVTRDDCAALDAHDPLASHRRDFVLPEGVIYLVGNSLGALPAAAVARVNEVVEREWGRGLVGSWNAAGWIEAPRRIGAKIARLIGADDDEVICADSTSINLHKALGAALRLQHERPRVVDHDRDVILSERGNFPTDLYVAQAVAEMCGGRYRLVTVPGDEIAYHVDDSTAVLLLTHVNYRSGRMHDLQSLTRRAHFAGALTVWDLAHSAGAVPVDLNGASADFAVGCGYKYLNGGPGAPAFVYVARRHLRAMSADRFGQPLAGWFGHRAPFNFLPRFEPAASIDRFAVGTPPIVALAALECGVDAVLAAGIEALRVKSERLTQLFIDLVELRCDGLGLRLLTPRDAAQRGSQVSFAHENAWPIMQALIARGVVGDYREGGPGEAGLLRFGFAPLYQRYVDAWDAAEALREVIAGGAWRQPQFAQRKAAVT
jgi:kynureninase